MKFSSLSLAGAFVVHPEPVTDARGFFARVFCQDEFRSHGLHNDFPQHSLSYNRQRGTLRGLHFQAAPHAETKLVRCTRGSIHDVIVDIRKSSASYGQWCGIELSAANNLALYIPAGFAHGFITMEDDSEVFYMISARHEPGHGRTIRWDDPALAIQWPLQPVVISDQDRNAPLVEVPAGLPVV